MDDEAFQTLINYLEKVPSIQTPIAFGDEPGLWWVKFKLDIENNLAWNVVQELGYVINYITINDRLPTSFHPVSPPPYMNGGPRDYLSWVIESTDKDFTPDILMEILEGRLPRPVEDLEKWNLE